MKEILKLTKVSQCSACGQYFDDDNNPVGHPVPSRNCVDGVHEGPINRIMPAEILQENARLRLTILSHYRHQYDLLQNMIKDADLPELEPLLLREYRKGRRNRLSHQYPLTIDDQSSAATKNGYDMSNFDLSYLRGESKVQVKTVTLNTDLIRKYIKKSLGAKKLAIFLGEMQKDLTALRKMFVYFKEKEIIVTEPSFFQPIFTMFLEQTLKTLGRRETHALDTIHPYEFEVLVDVDGEETVKPLKGCTDIFVVTEPESFEAKNVLFQVELKIPFSSLYHKTSDTQKHQLVCEMMGIRDELGEGNVGGILTDLFSIAISISFEPNIYYVATAVTDPEEYLLCVLTMFTIKTLSESCFRKLCSEITERDDENNKCKKRKGKDKDNNDEEDKQSKKRNLRNRSAASSRRKQGMKRSTSRVAEHEKENEVNGVIAMDEDERIEHQNYLKQWYAEHFGFALLTTDNLNSK